MRGRFDGAALDERGAYRAYREGDAFMVAMPSSTGEVRRRVELVTGSHHLQVYWVAGSEGVLEAFAFAYLLPEARWVPNESTLLRPAADASAQRGDVVEAVYTWNRVCVKCHAVDGVPGYDARRRTVNTSVAELGIACEACHGPGKDHVTAQRARDRGSSPSDGDPTIVDPRASGAAAGSQICGQCHSITVFHDDAAWVRQGRDGAPPDPISAWGRLVRHPLAEAAPGIDDLLDDDPDFFADRFWSDGQVRISGREYNGLIESPCFESGEFGCTTCHRMHEADERVQGAPWVDDQLREGVRDDRVCGRCHEALAADVSAHSHHAADSSGSACSNCHLPHTTYGLLGAMRSHTIDSPSVEASVVTGRPNACNLCHLDRSLAWTDRALTRWYGRSVDPQLGPELDERSAAARWLVAGDAGQRALIAWHLGWEPARTTSRIRWAVPRLTAALDDPYPAIRIIAERSLAKLGSQPRAADLDPAWLEELWKVRDLRPVRLAE